MKDAIAVTLGIMVASTLAYGFGVWAGLDMGRRAERRAVAEAMCAPYHVRHVGYEPATWVCAPPTPHVEVVLGVE